MQSLCAQLHSLLICTSVEDLQDRQACLDTNLVCTCSVDATLGILKAHDIGFHVNTVPGTGVRQVFFFDPDGNGIELGDFPQGNPPYI